MSSLAQLDPATAWSPYQPSPEAPWDLRRAAHLYRRAGFGAPMAVLERAVDEGPDAAVARLVVGTRDEAFEDESRGLADAMLATGDTARLAAWWLHRMRHAPDPLAEKLTLFWHGHFATSGAKVEETRLMLDQNHLLRRYARGPFAPLVEGISRDPAMLIYLDSTTNRRSHPNENYARELMELFCLGTGNYTERDIQELARAFTGWEVRQGKFRFNRFQHDPGAKTILGRTGAFGGEQGVEIVLANPAASRWIAGKLFRFFVCDEPAPSAALVEPLARQLRESNFDVGAVTGRILASRLFFSDHAVARKVRSPVELAVGLLTALEAGTNAYALADDLRRLGQGPFFPPSVKGWDGGRTWINARTLVGRTNLVGRLAREGRFEGGSLAAVIDRGGTRSPTETVDHLLRLLVAATVTDATRDALVELATGPDRGARLADLVHAIGGLPEFQLG